MTKSVFEGRPVFGMAYVNHGAGHSYAAMAYDINAMTLHIHTLNYKAGWWHDPFTGELLDRNDGEIFALIHSEISEALEGHRRGLMDDHLPEREMVEVELADAVIRIMDYAGARGYDLGGALVEKLQYNQARADHKRENRIKDGGKKI